MPEKKDLNNAFDELAKATWKLYCSMKKAGFSRKQSFDIARDWFLTCVHSANQQSSMVNAILQNIDIPKVS